HLRHRMPAPARVALDLEGPPLGLPGEVNPALTEEGDLRPAPGTGAGRTGAARFVKPDGWRHSITSSARASTAGGLVRPRAFAVSRLMIARCPGCWGSSYHCSTYVGFNS